MIIDIFFFVLIGLAIFKGYSKGLVVAAFSFIAVIVGLAAALKLSASVANWLKESTTISSYWLPFLSFLIVMMVTVFVIRIGAKVIEKSIQLAMLGWVNKVGGILLFVCLYISCFSVILFYLNKMSLLKPETFIASKTYLFIEPWAPKVIEIFGKIIPLFKDVFLQLENFFEHKL